MPEVTITAATLGEFGVIRRLVDRLPTPPAALLGTGDDAAVVATPDGRVVTTTDLLVEGTHFRRDWSSAVDIGRKAAAQNLADVAAMGARPTALLIGLAIPPDLPLAWLDDIATGLGEECARVGAGVVGGDVVRAERVTLAITALGDLAGQAPLMRSGARPGQIVLLAGRVGWAAAGLAVLRVGDDGLRERFADLVEAHTRPRVAYDAVPLLREHGASALIDVSDGLVADLGHVAAASGVGIELGDEDTLRPDPRLREAAAALGEDPREWLLGGGDDHPFAATLPPDGVAGAQRAQEAAREAPGRRGAAYPLVEVGRVVAGEGVSRRGGGPPQAAGHDHFAGEEGAR